MKPFIVCHMMASLDGRIDCDMLEAAGEAKSYYKILADFDCDAFVEGKVSRAKHAALPGTFESNEGAAGFSVHKATQSKKYAVSFDTKGTLLWKTSEIDGNHLICVVSEDAGADYLSYIKEKGISFIAVGKGKIDIARAVEILADDFGIKRIALVGGGNINGAFLDAGLIDEVSMIYGPLIDGRAGMAAAFDGLSSDKTPNLLKLKEVKQFDDDCVWMRYGF